MKLYNSLGPNPRVVRMFLLEKGIEVPSEEIDIMTAANRRPPYTDRNPGGQMPALELDEGICLSEITVICEYFEDTHPQPPLVGSTPAEKAETRMWTRRLDLGIAEPLANAFRYSEGLELFKGRMRLMPQAANDLKANVRDKLAWLDGLMTGKEFIVGDRFTLADIFLYSFLDFGGTVGQALSGDLDNLPAWFQRIGSRPSAEGSIHPAARAGGMRA